MKQYIFFILLAVIIIGFGLFAFTRNTEKVALTEDVPAVASLGLKYLPLGDSYTIGQSVSQSERFPDQLVARLAEKGIDMHIVANPAVTGYTSQNLIDQELPLVSKFQPDFITLAIGVNDYVQGVSIETFRTNLNYILDNLNPGLKQVVLVTIPDFGKTPAGATFGKSTETEKGIADFNTVIKEVANKRNLALADIFSESQQVVSNKDLTAGDGLHPSGKQYSIWVQKILPLIQL